MDVATEHVRGLARRVTAAALELGPLRAALLAGSGARGDADFYSDVDLLLYVDELPPEDRLGVLQEAQNDIFDIFTHVTGLGQSCGIGDGKRNIKDSGEAAG